MVVPVLAGIGATLGGIYSVGRAVDNYKYWNDYFKNTRKYPKYPARAGSYDWMGYSAGSTYAFSKLKRL